MTRKKGRKTILQNYFANLKMMAVRYHGCTCHLRYSAAANQNQNSVKKGSDNSNTSGKLFLRIDNRLLRNDYVVCFPKIEETYFLG